MSFVKDTLVSALSTVVITGSRLVVTILLARQLAPATYGEFVFAQWSIDFAFLICSIGLPGAMTRFLPILDLSQIARGSTGRRLLAGAVLASFVACLIMAAVLLHASISPSTSEATALTALCVTYLFASFAGPALQGLWRYDALLYGNLAFAAAAPGLVLFLLRQPSLTMAAAAMAAAWLLFAIVSVGAVVLLKPARARPSSGEAPALRSIANYAGNVWIAGLVAGLVWSRGELGVLKFHVDSAQIAFYATALSLAGLVTTAAQLLTGAMAPHLASIWHGRDIDRTSQVLRAVTQLVLMLTIATSLGLICFGDVILPLVFGEAYVGSLPILAILAIATVSIACGSANTLLQIETNGRFGLLLNVIGLVILLVLSVGLLPLAGVLGAAAARTFTQNVMALLTFYRLGRIPELRNLAFVFVRSTLLAIAGATVCYLLIRFLDPGPIGSAAVFTALTLLLCGAVRALIGVPLRQFATAVLNAR